MKDWWDNLQPRERAILGGSGLILILLGLYLGIWEPLAERHEQLQTNVAAKRGELEWMRAKAAEAIRLREVGASARAGDGRRSLLAIVDSSIERARLKGELQRMEPDGGDAVKLWFNAARFDELMRWLDVLRADHGLSVGSLRLKPVDQAGLVDVNLSLKRAAS